MFFWGVNNVQCVHYNTANHDIGIRAIPDVLVGSRKQIKQEKFITCSKSVLVTGFWKDAILILLSVCFCRIWVNSLLLCGVQSFIISDYDAVWKARVLFYYSLHNSTVWSLRLHQTWGSTRWSQHTDTILHWCLSQCWSCKFYSEKNPCSVGMFYPPECLSHETDPQFRRVVQAYFPLCVSALSPFSLFLWWRSAFASFSLPPPHTSSKHSINNSI